MLALGFLDLLVSGDCLGFHLRPTSRGNLQFLRTLSLHPTSALCKAPLLPLTMPQSLWDLSSVRLHVLPFYLLIPSDAA